MSLSSNGPDSVAAIHTRLHQRAGKTLRGALLFIEPVLGQTGALNHKKFSFFFFFPLCLLGVAHQQAIYNDLVDFGSKQPTEKKVQLCSERMQD